MSRRAKITSKRRAEPEMNKLVAASQRLMRSMQEAGELPNPVGKVKPATRDVPRSDTESAA